MFAMICTDNLRYKKTKYYDSEYIVKGTLHINEHAYAFSHYEGAFEVLGIRWLSNYTKGRYSKDTGLEFSFGADTEEGRLLQEHKDEAIECILQTVHAYKLTTLDAWVEGNTSFCTVVMLTYQLQIMESGILHLEQLFRQAKVLADWSTTTTESHAVLTRQQAKLTPT